MIRLMVFMLLIFVARVVRKMCIDDRDYPERCSISDAEVEERLRVGL